MVQNTPKFTTYLLIDIKTPCFFIHTWSEIHATQSLNIRLIEILTK
jgi:hypothetical protein